MHGTSAHSASATALPAHRPTSTWTVLATRQAHANLVALSPNNGLRILCGSRARGAFLHRQRLTWSTQHTHTRMHSPIRELPTSEGTRKRKRYDTSQSMLSATCSCPRSEAKTMFVTCVLRGSTKNIHTGLSTPTDKRNLTSG